MNSSSSSSSSQQMVSVYLPDECWESIFRFIIINDKNDIKNFFQFNTLSLVSKQFLSITNRLIFSVNISDELTYCHMLKRFTNLTSLNLTGYFTNFNNLLCKISCFPLKQLTSLNIYQPYAIPANGLRAFSQKITTLTSLICSKIRYLNSSDLFLIAECFPMLQELDLSYPSSLGYKNCSSYVDGVEVLSLALIKLRKVNLSGFPINNQSLFHLFNNCKYLEEIIMFNCDEITNEGIASALQERSTLRCLSFSTTFNTEHGQVFTTSHFIDSLVSLKGMTCLVLRGLNISDELLNSIAREGLPLKKFVLESCTGHSCNGIICLLSKCQRIQHLDLQDTDFLYDQHIVQLSSSFLVDLVSINLSCCLNLTDLALFVLIKNCPSLSEIKMETIGGRFVRNSKSLVVEFGVYPQLKSLYLGRNSWLSDESIIMFASIFPNLQLLDLNYCIQISEGICEVLRKCRKIRHLNLAHCFRVNLLGMNFVVPNLEVLNLSFTGVDDETLYVISKNCRRLMRLLLEWCKGVTENGVKHVRENCRPLKDYGYLFH